MAIGRFAAAGLLVALCAGIVGCASGPRLTSYQLRHMVHTEVFYVQPDDNIVVRDSDIMRAVHVSEVATMGYLFGGLGAMGFVGNVLPDRLHLDDDVEAHYAAFAALRWPDRIKTAVYAALAQSPICAGRPVTVLRYAPDDGEMWGMAKAQPGRTLLFVRPFMVVNGGGDRLSVVLEVYAVLQPQALCARCDVLQDGDEQEVPIADESVIVSQTVKAEAQGTWERRKELGHRLHALTPRDYFNFWLEGNPRPVARFLAAAIPDAQEALVAYFGGSAKPVKPLPSLKLVLR